MPIILQCPPRHRVDFDERRALIGCLAAFIRDENTHVQNVTPLGLAERQ